MSEEAQPAAVEPAAPQVEPAIQTPEPSANAPATVEGDSKADAAAEPEVIFPKKYQNEDGTPNYDKLLKGFNSLEKKFGAKPGVAPISAEDYAFDFGEDFEVNKETETAFKAKAHEAGLSKAQYEFVMSQFKEHNAAQLGADPTWTLEKSSAQLKTEWGNDYDSNRRAARAAFDEFAPSDADEYDPVWNHPTIAKMMARMGGELGESSIDKPKSTAGTESVQKQIDELRNSPDYWTPENQAKVMSLYEKRR